MSRFFLKSMRFAYQGNVCNFILLSMMAVLFPYISFAETTNIVMVDVSGSMAGYGYGSENVVPMVKKQLDDFVAFSSSKGYNTKIIPFASNVYGISGPKLVIKRGNTNLYKAILYAQEKIQKGRNNIFLITDGAHNMQPPIRNLCAELEKLKTHEEDSVFYYYVAFSEKAKRSEVASLFDGKDNFVLLDSLYIPQKVSAKAKIQTHPSKLNVVKTQASNEENNDGLWLKLLMLLLVVICLVFVLWWLIPFMLSANLPLMRFMAGFQWLGGIVDKSLVKVGSSSDGFKSFMNQSIKDKMQQIQRLTNYIYKLPSKAREHVLNQLSPEMRKMVEEVRMKQMGRLPSNDKGTWNGEPGNSTFTVSDDYIWKDPKTGKMKVKEWRKKYKIANPIQVEYKNGEPIFDSYSVAETKTLYKENYNYSELKDLHNPVNDNLNRELDPSLLDQSATNPARDFVENTANDGSRCPGCRNTYHEKRDGETIQTIPDFIHSICTHCGGRSLAAIVQKR